MSQSVVIHEFETLKRENQSYKKQLILDKVEHLDVCLMALQSLPKDPSVILDKMSVHLANLKHLILEFTTTSHT